MNLKKTLSIFCLIFVTGLAHATTTTDKSEKTKSEKEKYNSNSEKPHEEAALESSKSTVVAKESTRQTEPEVSTNDPDSSYYSVNKFNYLFYFVYKMKYLSDEDPELKLGMAP